MTYNIETVEMLAALMCFNGGGDWSRPYTKRNVWRKRAMALMALAVGDKAEALRVMRGGA